MGWADRYIERLKNGETVQFRPKGNSMSGKIESGQLVTVAPVESILDYKKGDIVLCTLSGNNLVHLIDSIKLHGPIIRNNRGKINGFVNWSAVHGKVIKVEP